jgi:hypothetical protein
MSSVLLERFICFEVAKASISLLYPFSAATIASSENQGYFCSVLVT